MATLQPQLSSALDQASPPAVIAGPKGWKRRLEDPFNTYYRYPVALVITRLLMHTPVTPNQVSLVQPLFAAVAGYAVTFDDWRYHLFAVAVFEVRSILDCVDGSLARAKRLSSPNGHAIDGIADWLGVVFLYLGLFHYLYHHPPMGVSSLVAVGVAAAALGQGAIRSASSDYFKSKYIGIYERQKDDAPTILRDKLLALKPGAPIFGYADAFILWGTHLLFELERFDAQKTKPLSPAAVAHMVEREGSLQTRVTAFLWSISSGDAFLSFVVVSILVGQIWPVQVFFASFGTLWIGLFILYNVRFLRAQRRVDASAV
jgi:phosphatidylglycerophosphate synthase